MTEILIQLAHGAIALLIAVVAIYLALKLLGKIAKFVIIVVVIALVLWFVLSDHSIFQTIKEAITSLSFSAPFGVMGA